MLCDVSTLQFLLVPGVALILTAAKLVFLCFNCSKTIIIKGQILLGFVREKGFAQAIENMMKAKRLLRLHGFGFFFPFKARQSIQASDLCPSFSTPSTFRK